MSNEAWFVKVGYSYMPCQWRGYAFIFVMFLALVGSLSIMILTDERWTTPVSLGSFVALSLFSLVVAERFSRKA